MAQSSEMICTLAFLSRYKQVIKCNSIIPAETFVLG